MITNKIYSNFGIKSFTYTCMFYYDKWPRTKRCYWLHYGDVIMSTIASQITSIAIVCATVYSGADQRKHQSSAALAFVRGIHRSPVTGEFPAPRASNAENVSIWWRHHDAHLLHCAECTFFSNGMSHKLAVAPIHQRCRLRPLWV